MGVVQNRATILAGTRDRQLCKGGGEMKDRTMKLESLIERMDCRRGLSFSDLFSDFLDLYLSFFCNNPNERQKKLYDYMISDEEFRKAFIEAMRCYGDEAEGYRDPLGEPFMMRVSFGQNGQFFTPESVCKFMAKVLDPTSESINDPTCGSGRLLLSGLETARENGVEPYIHGNDLSITCAKMALANLLVNTASGAITCGDALKLDYKNYVFYKIDRIKYLFSGKTISTYWQYTLSDLEQVEEQREKWWKERYNEGFVNKNVRPTEKEEGKPHSKEEPKNQQKLEPLPVEYKMDNKGQYMLF